MTHFKKVRFYLFANSYTGWRLATEIKAKCKKKKLLKAIKKLSEIFGFKFKNVSNFVFFDTKPKPPFKRLPKSIKIYLEIEKELQKLSEEKEDEYSTATEEYQRQLLYPAIERAVGNFLTDVKNDNRFQILWEERFKSACYTYYKVIDKYKLPTMRTIPFLLRIIS